eukprot:1884777-Rhodomonas_salina.2
MSSTIQMLPMHSAAYSIEVNRALISSISSSDPIFEDMAVNPETSSWSTHQNADPTSHDPDENSENQHQRG